MRVCLLFFAAYAPLLWGVSNIGYQHAGYFSFRSNTTTLVLKSDLGKTPCVSIPSRDILHCGNDNYNRIVLKNTILQGLVEVTIIPTSKPQDWFNVEYFITSDYDAIHILSDSIIVNHPQYGSLQSGILNVSFKVNPLQYPAEYLEVIGIYNNTFPTDLLATDPIIAQNIEPASWFFKAVPAIEAKSETSDAGWMLGLPTHGYMEFVLSDDEILKHRRFSSLQDQYVSQVQSISGLSLQQASISEKINICILTSPNMDGQKSIWLQQTEFMDPTKFLFTWLLALPSGRTLDEVAYPELLTKNNVYSHLKKLPNVEVHDNPYNTFALDFSLLDEKPNDGSPSAGEVWNNDMDRLYKYIHDRFVAANRNVSQISPKWCGQFYQVLIETLKREKCDVVVYGNARGFSSDVFIVDVAGLLGIPTVTELLNLYLDIDTIPDAVVAPSTYAVEHESISTLEDYISTHRRRSPGVYDHIKVPLRTIIPPSVDAKVRFNPRLYPTSPSPNRYQHGCENAVIYSDGATEREGHSPCVSIGFVARLSPEKSPGLFLQAAYEILQRYPFARFTFVGDGILSDSLKQLAQRLRIDWAVTFLGWVSEDLPPLLRTFDIVVNPSLRAWSETFCIANIEVMSMEVPLVTFGVGGIGEYVRGPSESGKSKVPFTVASNAVLVNTATPEAVAEAVHYLILHPEVRKRLGVEGRRSVEKFFTVERQMEQYAKLYSDLHKEGKTWRTRM